MAFSFSRNKNMLKQLPIQTRISDAILLLNHITIVTVDSITISNAIKLALSYKFSTVSQNDFQCPYEGDSVVLLESVLKNGHYHKVLELMNIAGCNVFNIMKEKVKKKEKATVVLLNSRGEKEKQELAKDNKILFDLISQVLLCEDERTVYVVNLSSHLKSLKGQHIYTMFQELAEVSLTQLIINVKSGWYLPMLVSRKSGTQKALDKISLAHVGYYTQKHPMRLTVSYAPSDS